VVQEDSTVIPLEQAEYALARVWPSRFAYEVTLHAEKR
jgi:hypothetical protein